MELIETMPGDDHFHLFENLPKNLYPENSIRHQEPENLCHEFLHQCYVVTINNEPVARAALYLNPALNYKARRASCIGNYECVNQTEVSDFLINKLAEASKGADKGYMIGPMNGSTWDNYRFSMEHQYPNFLLEPFHPLYYNDQFVAAGFNPISRYTSSINQDLHCDMDHILALEQSFQQAGVLIRSINLNDYENELQKLYFLVKNAFKTNFLYTPVSQETFSRKHRDMAALIDPELVLVAEDSAENLIGFIFSYPDRYQQNGKCLVVKTMARDPDRRWSGLGHILANSITRVARKRKFDCMVHAFMIEDGTSTGVSKSFSGKVYKHYTLYAKKIS